jgi:hypothetical protein
MQVDSSIQIINGVYHVYVGPNKDPFTPEEASAINKFGEMPIQCGGSFVGNGGSPTFTLPNNTLLYPSQFPCRATFSTADFPDAAERAVTFRDTIINRLTAAKTNLMSKTAQHLGFNTITI